MSKPKNWPDSIRYLKAPLHSKELSATQLASLRSRPADLSAIPASATLTPSPNVKIQPIRDPSHPANGQYGLFAAQNLKPGAFILAYLGRVHAGGASSEESDYDLWLSRDDDGGDGLAVDAASEGNEGRFVNDYRGVGERANAVFGTAFCERWGEVCMGVWVLGGKNAAKGIRKGEEILVSYGKGFWEERLKASSSEMMTTPEDRA
ncbi:nucleoporin SONB [Purpureocillium lavendulum]|uniref:Nucleoporin SONB n=1 Tax=Purpureocillium lavendulum TaxID=1247861 RepID=A0AB34FSE0_9HYPO|nr:nucleoporin SONB [Purpureocillium lavendulum]